MFVLGLSVREDQYKSSRSVSRAIRKINRRRGQAQSKDAEGTRQREQQVIAVGQGTAHNQGDCWWKIRTLDAFGTSYSKT